MPKIIRVETHTSITADQGRAIRRLRVQAASSTIENVNTVAASGSTETLPDVTTATMHDVTLTANCTLTFPTAAPGKSFSLRLLQDGTGSRTVTWPTVKWAGGTPPTLSTAAGASDDFAFVCFASTWHGFFAGRGMA